MDEFKKETEARILANGKNKELLESAKRFMLNSVQPKYVYNFNALGRPIIQYPQDMVAMQELIWEIQPDLIIETGIAHGGSLILSASMLALIDMCDAIANGSTLDPNESERKVLGVDIDIRAHNRQAVEEHPMSSRIEMIQGSSIEPAVIARVKKIASNYSTVMVCLDSNHTHDHVLAELEAYAPLTSIGSYCVVFDTIVEDLPAYMVTDRPWGPGDNPKTAVHSFLKKNSGFKIDKNIESKILITCNSDGYLKRLA